MGRDESSTEHLLLEVLTDEVLKARSARRRPESEQVLLGDEFLLRMTLTQWSTKGDGYSEKTNSTAVAVPTVPTSDDVVVLDSVPILRPVRRAEFAPTPGCSECPWFSSVGRVQVSTVTLGRCKSTCPPVQVQE